MLPLGRMSDSPHATETSSLDVLLQLHESLSHVGLLHVLAVTFVALTCRFWLCGWKHSYLDIVLALICSVIGDQIVEWGKLTGDCHGRMSAWLLGIYLCICVSNLLYCTQVKILGIKSCLMLYISKELNGVFLPGFDSVDADRSHIHRNEDKSRTQTQVVMQAIARSWIAMLLFLSLLTVSGFMSFIELLDSECVLDSNSRSSTGFVLATILVCGASVVGGAGAIAYAKVVSSSLNRGSAALNAIADKDFIERWGAPAPILEEELKGGLKPGEIACMPCCEASWLSGEVPDCAICLSSIEPTDRVRQLPNCGHAFHRPCVDQWLLRAVSCPLCKVKCSPVCALP